MAGDQRLVCVKKVKQQVQEEWDESMPLPGDIIEGIAKDDADNSFISTKARSELFSELRKVSQQDDTIWLKVRRGNNKLNLRASIMVEGCSKLKKKYTIRAASDERHEVDLADLSFQQCLELQEMSRRVVNVDSRGFNQQGIKYDWRMKTGTYLSDDPSTIISSILFMPQVGEHNIEATTARAMVWLSAAVS